MVRYEPGYAFKELNPVQWQCSGTPKVLIPVANGSEKMEVLVTVDVLRRANADAVVASTEGGAEVVVARHGTRIVADALLHDAVAAGQQFDLVIVPGGMPGAKTLAGTEALLKAHAAAGRAYGAIGGATAQVLEPHGLLGGKKATTCASTADPSECGSRVVVDGNLATSGSPGTAMEFALAVAEKLLGPEAAREVAEALLFV
ncbi:protein DJ-1 homolog B-like [Miscanthus floridulus]|uniref:protein DJ-1 homolog B-like n=1 Tax=Miscanthus floridulus TaxID=154761 RepID=UPI00345AB3CA